jgi:hypothetical protein
VNWHIWVVSIIVGLGVLTAPVRYVFAKRWPPPKEPTPRTELVSLLANGLFGIGSVAFFLTWGIDALTVICAVGSAAAWGTAMLLSYERNRWRRSSVEGKPVGPYPTMRDYRKV